MASDNPDTHRTGDDTRAQARAEAERLLRKQDERRRASERVFTDGQLLAGRYRVLELLQQGGSGQVYRAIDEELGETLALKALHPGVSDSPQALDRFKQEALLARSVTHENVCRLFELVRHETGDDREPLFFLTMELVEGETLAQYAERAAPLPLEQIVDLGTQIGLGLRAAHRKGVVHRDLKGQNVLVQELENGGLRAVLTDFGLAITPEDPSESDGPLVGTPLTMAPEQVRGEPVGEPTDLYALGLLLYHLGTGQWPFSATTPLGTAIRRLEQAPTPPRQLRPELPRELESLILDCLRVAPEERPRSVDDVLERLRRLSPGMESQGFARAAGETTVSVKPARPIPRIVLGASAALLLALVVAFGLWRPEPGSSVGGGEPQAEAPRRPSLLWLGFVEPDRAPDDTDSRWLEALVTAGLSASLTATGELRLLAGERAEQIRRELSDLQPGPLGSARVERLKRRAGVDAVLSGRAESPGGGRLRLELYLQGGHSPSQEPLVGLVAAEDLADLGDQVGSLATELRARLDLAPPTAQQDTAARAEIPSDPEAARLYAQGLSALRQFETRRAAERLQQSLQIEPDHPKVLSTLSGVWMRLGHNDEARQSARRAYEQAGGLSRAQQMSIEAQFHLRHREWQRAEQIFTALWEFFPDEAEHGLGLVEALDRAGELDRALAVLDQWKERSPRDPQGSSSEALFALSESLVAYHQGDYVRSQEAARRAMEIGETLEAPALVAEALVQESLTRLYTDADLGPVQANLHRAIELLEQLGKPRSLVLAQLYLADCARRADQLPEAEAGYRRAIATATRAGNNADRDRARTSLAILLDLRGRLRDGLVLKQQVLQSYRERRVVQGAVIAQENIAITLLKMGRPADALEQLAEVEQRYGELGDQIGLAWAPYYQGRAWLDRGELALAARHLEKARELAGPREPQGSEAVAPEGLAAAVEFEQARLAWTRGDLPNAQQLVEPLVDYYRELGRPFDVAESKLLLAKINRHQHRWLEAAQNARDAHEHFESAGFTHQAVAAQAEVTETEMAQLEKDRGGSSPAPSSTAAADACRELAEAPALEHRRIALLAAVTSVNCRQHESVPAPELLAELERITTEAESLELFLPELRAKLLAAQILRDSGRFREAQAELEALQKAARERGFGELALPEAPRG